MKFVRFGVQGLERAGVLDDRGRVRDLSSVIADITPDTIGALRAFGAIDRDSLPLAPPGVRLGPPVARVGKLICVGLNYRDHCEEAGYPIPTEPILFMKAITAISGPDDDVVLPRGATKGDWEVELAFVMGRRAQYVDEAAAMDHVAGFATLNDVTERRFQLEQEGQWTKGKGCDTFAPFGPWLVTPDEAGDIGDLALRLSLNGRLVQDSSTRHMIFGVPFLVSYISRFMTLMPGDVIATGTPPGVGLGMKPQLWLQPGDVMDLEVQGLGRQRQTVRAYEA